MTRTKQYRRNKERVKDLRRRHLYRNNAINGRYEISDKEDDSVTDVNNPYNAGWWMLSGSRNVIAHHKLDNKTGHYQEYPKTKYYGSKGYYRMKGWKCRAFKERMLSELAEKEKNIQEND